MILGMGTDMVDIRRIEKTFERFGNRFLERTFSEEEINKAMRRKGSKKAFAGTLAKRFAAKEACSKALGTGFNQGVFMRDIRVVNLPSGKPVIELHGGARRALENLQNGKKAQIELSLTDEYPYAQAHVMIVTA